jgi:hypothetical protein
MALTVKFYSVSKAVNSTALPTGEPMAEYECRMLDACSILRPVILLNVGPQANPTGANYAYIAEYSRYYWVSDWTVKRGQWVATLTIDPLASWKTEIGDTYQYVLRSASASNPTVQDSMYPATSASTWGSAVAAENPFAHELGSGEYVLGVVGRSGTMGAVSYYIMTPAQFDAFGKKLYGDTSIYDVTESEISAFKTQFNPLQYIVYCQWFPFTISKGAAQQYIDFGWWQLDTPCYKIPANPIYIVNTEFALPNHPQLSRGTYLNKSPFSRYDLIYGTFGKVPLDASGLPDTSDRTVNANMQVDLITGYAILTVTSPGGGSLAYASGKIGVDISLAQIAADYKGAAVQAIQTVGAAIASSGASLITGGVSGISNVIDSLIPQMRTSGSNGSIADYYIIPRIVCQFITIAAEDNDRLGRPLCARRKINTLSGYLQTVDTELQIPATSGEIDMIKSYMEGGIHYD